MRRKIFLVRETLSGNWRRLLHFPVLPGAPQIEWMPAKNGNRKGGRGRSGREGGKGQAKSCTTTVWTPPHGCLVWGPAAAGGQAAAASPATTAGQPRSSWNTSFPPKLRFPLTAALVSCLLQPDKNNSWPTATISRVLIAQLALPHLSSD